MKATNRLSHLITFRSRPNTREKVTTISVQVSEEQRAAFSSACKSINRNQSIVMRELVLLFIEDATKKKERNNVRRKT